MYAYLADKTEATIARNTSLYTCRKNDFKEGDKVWIYLRRKMAGKSEKMTNMWMGCFDVVRIINEVVISVEPSDFKAKPRANFCCSHS